MSVKNFFTFAAAVYLLYGLWYFFLPQTVAEIYGFSAFANPVTTIFLQFLGIYCIASGVLFGVARKAEKCPGRTAALAFLALVALLSVYMDVKTLLGAPSAMDYIDTVLNAFLGSTALYLLLRERKKA